MFNSTFSTITSYAQVHSITVVLVVLLMDIFVLFVGAVLGRELHISDELIAGVGNCICFYLHRPLFFCFPFRHPFAPFLLPGRYAYKIKSKIPPLFFVFSLLLVLVLSRFSLWRSLDYSSCETKWNMFTPTTTTTTLTRVFGLEKFSGADFPIVAFPRHSRCLVDVCYVSYYHTYTSLAFFWTQNLDHKCLVHLYIVHDRPGSQIY